jgi:hypothetical protein
LPKDWKDIFIEGKNHFTNHHFTDQEPGPGKTRNHSIGRSSLGRLTNGKPSRLIISTNGRPSQLIFGDQPDQINFWKAISTNTWKAGKEGGGSFIQGEQL